MPRKIAVLGCGAMGSVYAALLADAGHAVYAIDAWSAHMRAIAEYGLRLEGASGDRVVRLAGADTTAEHFPLMDLVIVATKARDVAAAAALAMPLLGPETTVLTIQNGLGSSEVLGNLLGTDRVIAGIAGGFGAFLRAPGHAHHNGMELIRIGELAGPATDRLRAIAALWRGAGFHAEACDDIAALTWEKLICNVTFSGPCAIAHLTIGEVMADAELWPVARACGVEAWEVARARGIAIAVTDPVAHITQFGRSIPGARPSLLLDHLAGRRSEIDAINGAIPREAAKAGITAPINAVVARLVRWREQGFS